MAQRSSTYSERGMTILEWGQLHTKPHIWLISCRVTALTWQELEEELNKLLLTKVSVRDRNVKVKMSGCVEVIAFCTKGHYVHVALTCIQQSNPMNEYSPWWQHHKRCPSIIIIIITTQKMLLWTETGEYSTLYWLAAALLIHLLINRHWRCCRTIGRLRLNLKITRQILSDLNT